jgi:hypothetical protein
MDIGNAKLTGWPHKRLSPCGEVRSVRNTKSHSYRLTTTLTNREKDLVLVRLLHDWAEYLVGRSHIGSVPAISSYSNSHLADGAVHVTKAKNGSFCVRLVLNDAVETPPWDEEREMLSREGINISLTKSYMC